MYLTLNQYEIDDPNLYNNKYNDPYLDKIEDELKNIQYDNNLLGFNDNSNSLFNHDSTFPEVVPQINEITDEILFDPENYSKRDKNSSNPSYSNMSAFPPLHQPNIEIITEENNTPCVPVKGKKTKDSKDLIIRMNRERNRRQSISHQQKALKKLLNDVGIATHGLSQAKFLKTTTIFVTKIKDSIEEMYQENIQKFLIRQNLLDKLFEEFILPRMRDDAVINIIQEQLKDFPLSFQPPQFDFQNLEI